MARALYIKVRIRVVGQVPGAILVPMPLVDDEHPVGTTNEGDYSTTAVYVSSAGPLDKRIIMTT